MRKKSQGNVMNLVTIGLSILAMTIVVTAYLQCTELMLKKTEVSQVSRKYILKMETEGYLSQSNENALIQELRNLGVQNIDLTGTTQSPVTYGDTIILSIRGNIRMNMVDVEEVWNGGNSTRTLKLEEKRMSTAKN